VTFTDFKIGWKFANGAYSMKTKKPDSLVETGKKFKKILGVLRDIRAMKFSLLAKLHFKDQNEPITISMQGERSADGRWNTWIPTDQNSGALQSRKTLKENLASIEKQVREYIVENELDADWEELETSINEALKSGLSVEELEDRSGVPIEAIVASSYKAHFCAPLMATAYAIEGAEALAKNDLNHASHCVDRGLFWIHPHTIIQNPNDRFSERAGTGGRGKALRYKPVKEKVAELLTKLAPQGGWESTSTAIKDVTDELIDNHSSFVEQCHLETDNLPRTIAEWIQVEPERFPHRIKPKT
jgi:hypothetical protein